MHAIRWMVTGASGQLGGHVLRVLRRNHPDEPVLALAGRGGVDAPGVPVRRIDLRDADALRACVAEYRPTLVLHLGALTAVGEAHARPQDAEQINTVATGVLAEATRACGGRLVFSSTDMVFDGTAAPYREQDPPRPLSQYGRTKAAAEERLLAMPHTLVVRIPLMYGLPCTRRETTFVRQVAALRAGAPLRLFTDEYRTPAWMADVARALVALGRAGRTGLLHVSGPERLSRYELVAAFARLLRVDRPRLEPVSRLSVDAAEPRPADLSLDDTLFRREFAAVAPRSVAEVGRAAVDPG